MMLMGFINHQTSLGWPHLVPIDLEYFFCDKDNKGRFLGEMASLYGSCSFHALLFGELIG